MERFGENTKHQLFDFRISTELGSSSMRYNNNKDEIVDDTLYFTDSNDALHKYPYTTDFIQQKYSISVGYLGLKNFYLYAKLPIVYSSVIEKFKYDTNLTARYERNNESKFWLEGLNLDAGYTIVFENLNIHLLGELFIPFTTYNNLTDTTDEPTYNKHLELERVFEGTVGTKIDYLLEPIRLEIGAKYNFRQNDFSDRLLFNFLIGLSSVEDTEFFANFNYVSSIGSYSAQYAANFWRETLWEKYFSVDVGFMMFVSDEFYFDVGYNIKLLGENSISTKTLKINLGYILK
jgi:hypothetical protein